MTALYVIIGAAIGAPSRFLLDQYLRRYIKYPLGITVINVLGSFVIGLNINSTDNIQALVSIGFAGAFTDGTARHHGARWWRDCDWL